MKKSENPHIQHQCCQVETVPIPADQQVRDRQHMQACLDVLQAPYSSTRDVPVAACIVGPNNQVIAQATNQSIQTHDPTAHAEIAVIRQACRHQANYRLPGCTLYVTLEPCLMCFAACMQARITRIVFAASDYKLGLLSQVQYQQMHAAGNHHFSWTGGVLAENASQQITDFFRLNCRK